MLIVTGSIGFDYIMDFPGLFRDRIMPDKIHQISLSFLVDKLKRQWGGTAGNIAYTLGLFGNKPLLFATAGSDFASYKKYLEKNGVDTSYVKEYKDITTGSYFVITDQEDNQIGAFYTGAMQHARKLSLKKLFNLASLARRRLARLSDLVVIAPNDPDAMRRYVRECRSLNISYMYDPAFQIGNFSRADLKIAVTGAEILIGNDYEIEMIRKKLKMTKKALLQKVSIMITTLGSKGAVIEQGMRVAPPMCAKHSSDGEMSEQKTIHIKPAKPKNTSDPTGAGDCFRAGFLAGYLRELPLQTCGQMGATAAVYTVEKYGTTTHHFTLQEFKKRYMENYGETRLKFL